MVLRSLIIAAKYGTFTEEKYQAFKNRLLTKEEIIGELTFGPWGNQPDNVIRQELKNILIRHNIDLSLFYCQFLEKVSNEQNDFLKEPLVDEDLLINKSICFIGAKYSGYNLCRYILAEASKES